MKMASAARLKRVLNLSVLLIRSCVRIATSSSRYFLYLLFSSSRRFLSRTRFTDNCRVERAVTCPNPRGTVQAAFPHTGSFGAQRYRIQISLYFDIRYSLFDILSCLHSEVRRFKDSKFRFPFTSIFVIRYSIFVTRYPTLFPPRSPAQIIPPPTTRSLS